MTTEKLRTFYNERRRKGPGLIALGVIGIINWIVSDVLNFSSLVSQLNIDTSAFTQIANTLLPDFGLFGTLLSDLNSTISPRRVIYQAVTIFLMGCLTAGLSYLLVFLRTGDVTANMAAGCFWQPLYSALLGPLLFWPVGWCMHLSGRGRRRYLRGALLRH